MIDLKGQTLGRYQILERLGRGGMADVYKAYQPQLDRFVAIKLMHAHLAEDEQFISRFQREAKSVAALRHPHIVQVFDFDIQDGMYYMVMEYIEDGKTLKEVLTDAAARSERVPTQKALEIIAKLADALEYAHGRGMVHRDIKPSNVLLSDLDHPVLSDFGIAKLIGQTGLTASGAMIGTPAYMSPEQGRGEQADERSDIYALGIILYEMLTGHPPYDADTPYAVILKHINAPLVTPRNTVPELPVGAERVVMKSLAKTAEDRFQTAGEMRRALLTAIQELEDMTPASGMTPPSGLKPVSATMVGSPSEEDRTMPMSASSSDATMQEAIGESKPQASRRVPLPLLIGGALLAVLICGVVIVALLSSTTVNNSTAEETSPPDEETSESVTEVETDEPEPEEDGEEEEEEAISPEVQDLIDQAHAYWDQGDNDNAIATFEQAVEVDPENTHALTSLALLFMGRNEGDRANEFMEQALAIEPDDGYVQYAKGMLHWTVDGYFDVEAAHEAFSRSVEDCSEPWVCADAYYQKSYIEGWTFEDWDAAQASIEQAIALQPDPHTQADYYSRSGEYRYTVGDFEGALADFEQAYSIDGGTWYLNQAARYCSLQGDYERGHGYYETLLADNAGDPRHLIGIAYMEYEAGNPEAAMESTQRAMQLDPNLYGAHYMLGLLELQEGDYEAALAEFEALEARNLDEEGYWLYEFPFFTWGWGNDIYYQLAQAAYGLGDTEAALGYLAEAINQNSGWPDPYMLKGQIFADAGDLAAAREQYLLALDVTYDDEEKRAEIEERLAALAAP